MSQQDKPEVDWSKMSGAIASRASDAVNEVGRLYVNRLLMALFYRSP